MALTFASTRYIDIGSGASLDNIATGTILTWVYPTSVATFNRRIFYKLGSQGLTFVIADSNAGDLVIRYTRSTSATVARTAGSYVTTGAWQCLAGVWDSTGANGDQHLYRGTLTSPLSEPSYAVQAVGSGTHDDAAGNALLGGVSVANSSFIGDIALAMIWNRALSLTELIAQQWNPHVTSGCVGFWSCGWNGTGTQPDWSGNENNGTVTGATVAAHVPLRPLYGGFAGWRGNYTAPAAASGHPAMRRWGGVRHMLGRQGFAGRGW